MISVDRKRDVETCPVCGVLGVKVYLVTLGALQFIICHNCLIDLKYKIFLYTRCP